jgi:hypothetical protein
VELVHTSPSPHGAEVQSAPSSTIARQAIIAQRSPAMQSASTMHASPAVPAEHRLLMQARLVAHSYGEAQPLPRPRTIEQVGVPGCELSQNPPSAQLSPVSATSQGWCSATRAWQTMPVAAQKKPAAHGAPSAQDSLF